MSSSNGVMMTVLGTPIPPTNAPPVPAATAKRPMRRKAYGKRRVNWFPLLLLTPLLVIMVIFFVVPLSRSVVISFFHFSGPGTFDSSQLTIQNYKDFLSSPFYLGILRRTFMMSLIVTILCVAIGYPVSYYMMQLSGRKQQIYMFCYLAPWLINVVVKAFGWTLILSPAGYINTILLNLGIIQTPLHLMYNDFSMIVGLTQGEMVFAVMPILASLVSINPELRSAAADLGASRVKTFMRITLPLSLPGIVAGSVFVFTMSMAAYTTPALLGGVKVRVMSYIAYQQNTSTLNFPFGSAVSVILVIFTIVVVQVYMRAMASGKRKVIFR